MNGFFEYILKVLAVLLKIGAFLFIIGVIIYFSLTQYLDYRIKKVEEQEKVLQEQRAKEKAEYDKLHAGEIVEPGKAEKETAYSRCINEAYKSYKAKYDEECSKFILDGECIVTQEKRYELDGIYMHDKEQCEKLNE